MDGQERGTDQLDSQDRIKHDWEHDKQKPMNPNDILLYSSERLPLAADGKFYGDPQPGIIQRVLMEVSTGSLPLDIVEHC